MMVTQKSVQNAQIKMISLGVDESYANFGISVVDDKKKILRVKSYNFKGMKSKTEKRMFVAKLIKHAIDKYNPDIVVVERVRLFSQKFLSRNYIKATSALIAVIVDNVYPNKVYSVDTRSWKSKVCGSSKGKVKGDKQVSVRYIKKVYNEELNDDQADAVCIALYGLDFDKNKKLFMLED